MASNGRASSILVPGTNIKLKTILNMCKYCETLMKDKIVVLAKNCYCDLTMLFEHERDGIVIDSFVLKASENDIAGIIINYCPICGTKLNN